MRVLASASAAVGGDSARTAALFVAIDVDDEVVVVDDGGCTVARVLVARGAAAAGIIGVAATVVFRARLAGGDVKFAVIDVVIDVVGGGSSDVEFVADVDVFLVEFVEVATVVDDDVFLAVVGVGSGSSGGCACGDSVGDGDDACDSKSSRCSMLTIDSIIDFSSAF